MSRSLGLRVGVRVSDEAVKHMQQAARAQRAAGWHGECGIVFHYESEREVAPQHLLRLRARVRARVRLSRLRRSTW